MVFQFLRQDLDEANFHTDDSRNLSVNGVQGKI